MCATGLRFLRRPAERLKHRLLMNDLQALQAELERERKEKDALKREVEELRAQLARPHGEKAHKENDKQKGAEKEEQSDSTKEGFPSYLERKGMGVRVLDLSRVLAGPYCSLLLSDLGADVLKLEIPGIGDDSRQFPPFKEGQSLYYVNLNRGKKSITLDLKDPVGKHLFMELVKKSDVVLENFSTGTMERLGIGYNTLKEVNPGIIYASITGFGQTGPYSARPGYDIIAQAMSGLMSITGWPDSPPTRAGTAVGDVMAALFTTIGILAALQERSKTGKGQMVDVALVDSLVAVLGQHLQKFFVSGETPEKIGNRYEFIAPYDSFKAADGWIIIAIANDAIWNRFVACTEGCEDMSKAIHSEEYDTNIKRVAKFDELKVLIEAWTVNRKVADLVPFLNDNRIPACPINDLAQVADDEHIAHHRDMVQFIQQPGLGEVKVLGNPIKLSETPAVPRGPAPSLGQHTQQILFEVLGLTPEDVLALHKKS